MKIINAIRNLVKSKSHQPDHTVVSTVNSDFVLNPEFEKPEIGEQLEEMILSDNIKGLDSDGSAGIDDADQSATEDYGAVDIPVDQLCLANQLSVEENNTTGIVDSGDQESCMIGIEDEVVETDNTPPSLLENAKFIKLVEECVDAMNEFESYTDRMETEEGKAMTKMIVMRLQESLERSGLERIDDINEPFSILKHKHEPMMPVAEGETLNEIIAPGLAIENRVFRKAKVNIKQD